MNSEPHSLTAADAAARIADGTLKAESLLRSCLERIRERQPQVHAWVHLDEEAAIASARLGPDTIDGIAPADGWQQWWQQQARAKREAAAWLASEDRT